MTSEPQTAPLSAEAGGDLTSAYNVLRGYHWGKSGHHEPEPGCPVCASLVTIEREATRARSGLDAGRGWWHPEGCIDQHDPYHNCLDIDGSIIGWRDFVTSAALASSGEAAPTTEAQIRMTTPAFLLAPCDCDYSRGTNDGRCVECGRPTRSGEAAPVDGLLRKRLMALLGKNHPHDEGRPCGACDAYNILAVREEADDDRS